MDKYKLIRELGLQVFTKPLGPDVELVSADDLALLLNTAVVTRDETMTALSIVVKRKPLTFSEKILSILADNTISQGMALEKIRDLVEARRD